MWVVLEMDSGTPALELACTCFRSAGDRDKKGLAPRWLLIGSGLLCLTAALVALYASTRSAWDSQTQAKTFSAHSVLSGSISARDSTRVILAVAGSMAVMALTGNGRSVILAGSLLAFCSCIVFAYICLAPLVEYLFAPSSESFLGKERRCVSVELPTYGYMIVLPSIAVLLWFAIVRDSWLASNILCCSMCIGLVARVRMATLKDTVAFALLTTVAMGITEAIMRSLMGPNMEAVSISNALPFPLEIRFPAGPHGTIISVGLGDVALPAVMISSFFQHDMVQRGSMTISGYGSLAWLGYVSALIVIVWRSSIEGALLFPAMYVTVPATIFFPLAKGLLVGEASSMLTESHADMYSVFSPRPNPAPSQTEGEDRSSVVFPPSVQVSSQVVLARSSDEV